MLKVNEGTIEVSGTKIHLMAELSGLLRTLVTEGVLSEEDLNMCIDASKKTPDEIKEETLKNILDFILSD